jgi:hypothetical protein
MIHDDIHTRRVIFEKYTPYLIVELNFGADTNFSSNWYGNYFGRRFKVKRYNPVDGFWLMIIEDKNKNYIGRGIFRSHCRIVN